MPPFSPYGPRGSGRLHAALQGVCHVGRLHGLFHVVDAHQVRAAQDGSGVGRQGCGQPLLKGWVAAESPGHPLAGGRHQKGAALHLGALHVGKQRQVFLQGLAKAHAGVKAQPLWGDAQLPGGLEPVQEEPPHPGADVPAGGAWVHDHAPAAGARRHRQHLRPKARHVVEDGGPGLQSPLGHPGVERVYGNGQAGLFHQGGQHVSDARPLLLRGDGRIPRPGGLPPHVNEAGPLRLHLQSPLQGGGGVQVFPPVGEGVRGHVQNAHHVGPVQGEGKLPRLKNRRVHGVPPVLPVTRSQSLRGWRRSHPFVSKTAPNRKSPSPGGQRPGTWEDTGGPRWPSPRWSV